MSLLRKFKRHLPSKDAVRKILLGLTAFSFFAGNAHASDITDKDGNSLIDSDNVHDLYAQELDGNLARSVYDKFNLSENEIANMHFNQQGGDVHAFNLVNFVNNRVDVNGTINAIRDGAIDGNLYFLSPEGIAVGSSGVINAGSFNAYAVDSSDFKDLRDGTMSDLKTQLATNINGGFLTPSSNAVEINGVINARNQIAIRGQSVTVADSATLNAKTDIDFSNLVNAGDTVNTLENLQMTVDPTGNGDIVIAVSAEHVATDSIFDSFSGTATTVWPSNKTTTLEPAVNINGALDATGNISIAANANTSFQEGSVLNLIGATKAGVLSQLGIDIDADWIDKTNNASITVGSTGSINAGGNVTLGAGAATNARIISDTPGKRNSLSNLIPSAAIVYAEVDNNAVIDVKGTVNAGGNFSANANADTNLYISATSTTDTSDDAQSSVLYAAIGIANADNISSISFDNTVNAGGDFSAVADSSYNVDNYVTTVTPDSSFLATAVGINQGDSQSVVNINADITAGGKLDIAANNIDVFNRLSVKNEIGSRGVNNPFEVSGSDLTDSLFDALGNWIGSTSFIGNHSFNLMQGDGVISNLLTGSYFKAGVSVGVLSNNHDAKVNVADGVKLDATNDLNLKSELTTAALHSDVTNVLNNKTAGSSTKVGVGGAVNVANVDNNSNVIVGKNVTLTGNNVAVNSNVKADYNQFTAELDYIKDSWSTFVNTCKSFGANFDGNDDIESSINDLENTSDKFEYAQKLADIQDKISERYNDYSFKQFTNTLTDGANIYTQLKIALKRTLGVIDPANYVNFYARASMQDNQTEDDASLADISGSVQVIAVDDNAKTILGEGVTVTGTDNADISSTASTDIVELTGQGGKYLAASDFGAGAGIGASIVVTGIDSYAVTAIGKNNSLNANSVTVAADNDVNQLGIIYGAGMAGKVGVSGMINMMYGDSFAIASVDDQTTINAPAALNVKADNDTDIVAVTGGVTLGDSSTAAAVGAGFNLNNFDVHSFATIADNSSDQNVVVTVLTDAEIADITAAVDADIQAGKIESDYRDQAIEDAKAVARKTKLVGDHALDVETKRADAVKALRKSLTSDQINLLGTQDSARGSINAGDITVSATTDGTVNSVAIEGSYIGDSNTAFDSFNKYANKADDFTNMGNSLIDYPGKKLSSTLGGKFSQNLSRNTGSQIAVDTELDGGRSGAFDASNNGSGIGGEVDDADQRTSEVDEDLDDDDDTTSPTAPDEDKLFGKMAQVLNSVSFQIAGAGSVAVNSGDGNTVAILDNAGVTVNNLTVNANDDLYNGAYSGAAALNWAKSPSSGTTGSVGAAASVNQGDRKVDAFIANSNINTSGGDLNLSASKDGVDVAAALGLAISNSTYSQSKTINVSAGVGVNLADNDVRALIVNSDSGANEHSFNNLDVHANSNSIQVAGGANVNVARAGTGNTIAVTANVMMSDIDNDLQAGIFNGNHFADNVDISTLKSDTQVNAALSLAVSATAGYDKGAFNFNGTVTHDKYTSSSNAFIDQAHINAHSVNLLNDQKSNDNSKRQTLTDQGLDITGSTYLGEHAQQYFKPNDSSGAVIVGAAVGIQAAASFTSGGGVFPVGASVAVNKINVDDSVNISNSTINSDSIVADSIDKLSLVNVSAGVAGSYSADNSKGSGSGSGSNRIELIHDDAFDEVYVSGFGAVGSVGWNVGSINNSVNVTGSNINARNVTVASANQSNAVNVAGEISLGDTTTVGLALADNSLNNTVQSFVNNSTIIGQDHASNSIDIDAVNSSNVVEVAACLNVSTSKAVVNANIAINKGFNNTNALVDQLTANNIDWLDICANDTANKTTIAGSVNVGAGSALGAGVAYTAIGNRDIKESLAATINNSNLTAREGANISLNSHDGSTGNTVAAGVAISYGGKDTFKFNAQGAGAASYIFKDVDAGISNSTVTGKPDLDIQANSDADITTVAAILAGSNNASISAAVGVASSVINQDTDSFFKNDSLNLTAYDLDNVDIRANSKQKISAGVASGAVTISDKSLFTAAGSGSYNFIASNTRANVDHINANADKNFAVVSQSDDILANYAGTVELSGGMVGMGVSASNNKITGDTSAKVNRSTLNVSGSDADDDLISVNHAINDGVLIDSAVNKNTWSAGALADNRSSETLSGIVVDASSTHALSSDLASVAVQFGSNGGSVAGSVNVAEIGGNTTAAFDNSSNATASNFSVGAFDYSNKGGFVGGAAGAANFAAGLSFGFSNVDRNVTASVNNSGSDALDIKANDFNLTALSRQGLSDFMLSAAGAVSNEFALETGDNVSRNNNSSTTTTMLNNVNVDFTGNADVRAEHSVDINVLNTAAGLAVGGEGVAGALNTGISINKDNATVENFINNSKLLGNKVSSTANINAVNASRINNDLYSIGAALALFSAGGAGGISVNNIETSTLNNITASNVSANNISVNTNDHITLEVDGGAGAVGSLAGVGAVVNVNNINNSTNANLQNSSFDAANSLSVNTNELRNFDSTLVAVAIGAGGAAVNVMVTNVNSDIDSIDSSYSRNLIDQHFDQANQDSIDTDYVYGLSDSAKQDLIDRNADMNVTTAFNAGKGVLTNVAGSTLNAGGNININSSESNDADMTNGSGAAGAVGVAVGDNIFNIAHQTKTLLTLSTVTGNSVNIAANQTQADQGIKSEVYEAGAGLLNVGVGYNSITLGGETRIDVKGSTVKGSSGNVSITANDDVKTDVDNLGVNIGIVGVPVTMGKSVNNSATRVVVDESMNNSGITFRSNLSASDTLDLKAQSANEADVRVQSISGGGLVTATTDAVAKDNNKASVVVNGSQHTFEGSTVNLTATSDPKLKTYTPSGSVQVIGFVMVDSTTELKGGAEVIVNDSNTVKASNVNYKATTGSSDKTTAYAEIYSINGSALSVDPTPNTAKVDTETTTKVDVAGQYYENSPAITVESVSQITRDAYADGYTIGIAAASGRDKADVNANDKVFAEIGSDVATENRAGSLTLTATNNTVTDLKATGGTGGILDLGSQSTTDNDNNTDVTAKLIGKWTVDGAVAINATSNDTVRGYVRQGHGGLAGGAEVRAYDDINGTTKATIDDGASITAGSLELNAKNNIVTAGYKNDEYYTLADYYGGALTGDDIRSKLIVKKNAYTDVGTGASITTTGAQTYTALSNGDIINRVNAAGGGLINGVGAHADTTFKTDNQVRFAKDSSVKVTEDNALTVKANDMLNLNSLSSSTNGGVSGWLFSYTENDLDRKNYIDVKGTLETVGNVEMEAGGTKDAFFEDTVRQIYVKTVTESNNYTLIQVSIPQANYSLTENNSINVDGAISGGRNVNMRADGGKVEVLYSSRNGLYSNLEHYKGEGLPDLSGNSDTVEKGTYATNLLGTGDANDRSGKEIDGEKTNYIMVNGSITAGNAVKDVAVGISGTVVPADYHIKGTTTNDNLKVTSDIEVGVTTGQFDYTGKLKDRYDTLKDLIAQYTTGENNTTDNTSVIAGFQAELARVEEKMRELGMIVKDGNRESIITDNLIISSVTLSPIELSGGNVNLNTAAVKGSGTLTAKGAPNLNITNTSNAYFIVEGVKLSGESGNVNFKGHPVLTGDAGLASTLTVSSAISSGAGNITVLNNPNIGTVNIVSATDNRLSGTYDSYPDMLINGDIDNVNGDVRIRNTRGDIDIAGKYTATAEDATDDASAFALPVSKSAANISGKNVYLEAAGTLSQGYVEGMVNIAGTPEDILRENATRAVNNARNKLNKTAASSSYSQTVATDVTGGNDNGRIAGNNICIAALDININGIIQAGYETYSATVNSSDVTALKSELANNNTAALDNRMKDSYGRYAVNTAAGAKFDSAKGYYNYEVPVYYDAASDKLVTENLETGGGQVYLSGRIGSTGSGRIFAANGYSTISFTNNTDLPIEFGNIINNNRSGKITIIDTAKDTWTEYTPGQTRTMTNYAQQLKEHFADGSFYDTVQTETNNLNQLNPATSTFYTATYTPAAGMRYHWTQGESTMTEEIYHHEEDGLGFFFTDFLFGWIAKGESRNKLESWERGNDPRLTPALAELETGGYFATGESTDTNLNLNAKSFLSGDKIGPIIIAKDTKVKSYVFVNKYTFTVDWKYETGSLQAYDFDINASQPITIGFLGRKSGPVSIDSKGSIYLTGNVEMSDADAPLRIWSNSGALRQTEDTYLRTGDLNLRSHNGITGINIETMGRQQPDGTYDDNVKLNVINLGGGDVDINIIGGTTDGHAMSGDAFFENMINASTDDAERGDIKVTATGAIYGAAGATAHNIVLESENGYIGSANKGTEMRLDASGAVDVTAKGDIRIGTAFDKTLTIGKLTSTDGRVFITKNGNKAALKQSATYQSGVKEVDEETLIHQWIDSGLIAPTADYPGEYLTKLNTAVADYATQVKSEYATYETGKEAYEALKATTANEYAEYKEVLSTYDDYASALYETFDGYLTETNSIRLNLQAEYAQMLKLQAKKDANALRKYEESTYNALQAKYAGCDGWEDYYIRHASELVTNPEYQAFIGYNDFDAYLATTHNGQLVSKYENCDSAEAYLATTAGYALEQKYGAYANADEYLATDAQYAALKAERDNITTKEYAHTAEELLTQAAVNYAAAAYNVDAKGFYIDNVKIKDLTIKEED